MDKLVKSFEFKDFVTAMDFVNKVAELAEELNHHPDILVEYNKVTISSWTHDTGGVTAKDEELMERVEEL